MTEPAVSQSEDDRLNDKRLKSKPKKFEDYLNLNNISPLSSEEDVIKKKTTASRTLPVVSSSSSSDDRPITPPFKPKRSVGGGGQSCAAATHRHTVAAPMKSICQNCKNKGKMDFYPFLID